MSSKHENIKNNFNILDINISNEDMNFMDIFSKKINYRIVTKDLFIEKDASVQLNAVEQSNEP